jgi:hypothetical protein
MVRYLTLEGKVRRQTQKLRPPLGVGALEFNFTSLRWRVL